MDTSKNRISRPSWQFLHTVWQMLWIEKYYYLLIVICLLYRREIWNVRCSWSLDSDMLFPEKTFLFSEPIKVVKYIGVIQYAMLGHSVSLKHVLRQPTHCHLVLWILRTRDPSRILNASFSAWHSQKVLWHRPFAHRCLFYTLML